MSFTSQHRLVLAIALSLAAHAALLHVDTSTQEFTLRHEQGGAWLQLQLQPSVDRQKQEAPDREGVAKKVEKRHITGQEADARQKTNPLKHANENVSTSDTAQDMKKTSESPWKHAADTVQVKRIIADEFASHFYYPAAAQRRNWQGDVILQFTLMPDGSIQHIRINKSSGYAVLDDAAMDVMTKIHSEDQLALALNGNSMNHILPVSYRLMDAF
ncbi:MAG: energy transducer TonB [Gammaproteobacteria bacterium]|nr:MAG: energy transducer TonB [Gammaproteobacteria bacterium]